MPIVPMPAKPTTGQPWLDVGYAWYDNVQQLITDVPQLKSDVLALQGTLANLQATRAPLANPSFTGTVSGVTAAMVGLGNVSNTADAEKTYSATQITSGTIPPARLPAGVAAVRRRTPANEAAPTATNWEPRPAGYPLVIAVGAAPAPSDAPATDLHVTPLTQTTAGTNFNGLSNGAPWPACKNAMIAATAITMIITVARVGEAFAAAIQNVPTNRLINNGMRIACQSGLSDAFQRPQALPAISHR